MPSNEQEIIKQIKIAEQQAEEQIKEAQSEAAFIIEKAQSDRVRKLEKAKNEAREILKQQIAEAKNSEKYEKLLIDARKRAQTLFENCEEKITDVAEKAAEFVLEME